MVTENRSLVNFKHIYKKNNRNIYGVLLKIKLYC